MLGIFVSTDGAISIVEGNEISTAPEIAMSPHNGRDEFKLLATDGVVFEGDGNCVAFYEEVAKTEIYKVIRNATIDFMDSLKKEAESRGVPVQRVATEHLHQIEREQLKRRLMDADATGMVQ
jgi:hypothetical protein